MRGIVLAGSVIINSTLGAALIHAATAPAGVIEQSSQGACSPPIANNAGQVTINCPGVDPEAVGYLEAQLTELPHKLSEQSDANRTIKNLNDLNVILRQQAADWETRYHDLSARLANSPTDSENSRLARTLIQQGRFDQAQAILEALAAKQDADVARAAETQYNLGDLAMLRFDPAGALPHYMKAYRYEPDTPRYADAYARAAYRERDYDSAEKALNAALATYREVAARDPAIGPRSRLR